MPNTLEIFAESSFQNRVKIVTNPYKNIAIVTKLSWICSRDFRSRITESQAFVKGFSYMRKLTV